jgi:TrmH family RNA methyltransferase
MELSQRRGRLVKRLAASKTRAKEGLVLVEGVRAVTQVLDASSTVSFAVTSPRLVATVDGGALAARLAREDSVFDVIQVTDGDLTLLSATDHPQGVLLICEEPEASFEQLLAEAGKLLVLDAVQDPGNVGTLIRSAVAFGMNGVVALDGTGDPFGAKAVRASAGTTFLIPVVRCTAEEAIGGFASIGLPLLVASAEGEVRRRALTSAKGFALALGNEGAGTREAVRSAAAGTIAVEMTGPVESLNVGIAGSILMHELTRADR